MSDAVSIEWPKDDVQAMFRQIERAQKELGKSNLSSIQWAARVLLTSVAASTKVSKKVRPIVRNPDKRYKTDRRRAPFGVMAYRDGKKVFRPIYRTGEFGGLRFFDKKTVAWYDRSGGSGQWRKIASGPDIANPEIIAPGIMKDKRRNIWRSGFAKKTWTWAKGKIGSGGTVTLMRVPNIAEVKVHRDKDNPGITVTNRLNYFDKALKGEWMAIDSAMARATRSLDRKIDDQIAKKMGAK